MRFSTIFVVLTAGVMALAGAIPETVAKRSITDVQTACTTLINKADTIISELNTCSDNTCTDPLVSELADAINACVTVLGTLPRGSQPGSDAIAGIIANAVTKIADGLNSHETNCGSCSDLTTTYARVDSPLSNCILGAFNAFTELKALVVSRLANVLATLQNLGMTSTLGALS